MSEDQTKGSEDEVLGKGMRWLRALSDEDLLRFRGLLMKYSRGDSFPTYEDVKRMAPEERRDMERILLIIKEAMNGH